METPEAIRTSLQAGEWVTSIDFKDAYFHIPIHSPGSSCVFHTKGQSYQFKALPFGLSTAPVEFTVVTQEVKLMALQRGIRIHQYLDDWLLRACTHDTCLQQSQTLVTLCQELGWLVKSQNWRPTGFQLHRFPVRPEEGKVKPTPERWQTLTDKIQSILSGPVRPVWQFMSLIGLLSNRRASPLRATSHESHTVALGKQLEGPRVTRKGDPGPQIAPFPSKVVAGGKQCATRSTITPS